MVFDPDGQAALITRFIVGAKVGRHDTLFVADLPLEFSAGMGTPACTEFISLSVMKERTS